MGMKIIKIICDTNSKRIISTHCFRHLKLLMHAKVQLLIKWMFIETKQPFPSFILQNIFKQNSNFIQLHLCKKKLFIENVN